MKRKILIAFIWFVFMPIYGQINFDEKTNIYDRLTLGTNIIYDDFDNDNDIDIIKFGASNPHFNVILQKNENGDLNLKLPKVISNNANPIVSLDINNDNYPDLITYYSYTTIGVMYNLQNDTFSAQQPLINFSGSYSISPIKFDYNNDGFMDLIVTDSQNNAHLLLNNQNGGFLPQQFLIDLGSIFTSIYKIEDFDNDGDFDLYIFNSSSLKIYLNNNGNFINPNILNVESTPFKEFGILDIDGNGYKDILYWKNGAIWAKYFGFNSSTNQLIVINDLPVVQNVTFYNSSNNSRSIFIKQTNTGVFDVYVALESILNQSNIHKFNINNGIFSNSEIVLTNFDINIFNLNNYKFIDLNNNGNIDFSFSSNFNSQSMLLVNYDIDNLIDKTICIQQEIYPNKFTVIDMSGDGIEDICIGQQNGLSFYEKMTSNDPIAKKNLIGVMTNSNASTYTLNYIMDFNNDGLGDVIDYYSSESYAKVFKNLGNDNFLYIQNITIPSLTSELFFVDIDNDGYKDLLFKKNYYSIGNELIWAKNNNGLNFGNIQPVSINYSTTINTVSLASEDFDSDGDKDIVLLSHYQFNDNFVYEIVLLENQNGIFSGTSIATLIGDYSGGSIKMKDIDQDGDLDIFVYDINSNPFLLYRNDGQSNFFKIIIDNTNIDDIEFDDNDGDGNYEIYGIKYNSTLYSCNIFYYKTINFLSFTKFDIDTFDANNASNADLLLVDYNNDSKKDLFVNNPNSFEGLVSVYMNTSGNLSIEETANDINLKIYPNPFTNAINWHCEKNTNYKIKLFTIDGILIYEGKKSNNQIDLSFLESGVYLFVVEDIDLNFKNSYKIIKK